LEAQMAMHHDHVTDNEDAAFDSTAKIAAWVFGVVAIVLGALWFIS
jgi:hypothetical protein